MATMLVAEQYRAEAEQQALVAHLRLDIAHALNTGQAVPMVMVRCRPTCRSGVPGYPASAHELQRYTASSHVLPSVHPSIARWLVSVVPPWVWPLLCAIVAVWAGISAAVGRPVVPYKG